MMLRVILAAAVAGGLASGEAVGATKMFGTTAFDGPNQYTLVEIDLSDGLTSIVGDPLDGYWTAMDMALDGVTLYAYSAFDEGLYAINSSNGTFSKIGELTYPGTSGMGVEAMSISPAGDLYVITDGKEFAPEIERLYTVDSTSGVMTLMGELDAPEPINAMEFAADGTLYAAFGSLHTLNPATGKTLQTLGDLGGPSLIGLDIDEDGRMIGLHMLRGELYTIDPADASATHLVDIVADEVHSLASTPALDVPEPATLTLLWLGVACAMVLARRRRA